jgi:hypothetical protein
MATNNAGECEWYTVECGGHDFTLPVRYQDLVPVGQGAFGVVM